MECVHARLVRCWCSSSGVRGMCVCSPRRGGTENKAAAGVFCSHTQEGCTDVLLRAKLRLPRPRPQSKQSRTTPPPIAVEALRAPQEPAATSASQSVSTLPLRKRSCFSCGWRRSTHARDVRVRARDLRRSTWPDITRTQRGGREQPHRLHGSLHRPQSFAGRPSLFAGFVSGRDRALCIYVHTSVPRRTEQGGLQG